MTPSPAPDEVRIARMRRWANANGSVKESVAEVHGRDILRFPRTLVAVTSSRLGHDVFLHQRVCQFLCRSMLDCRDLGGAVVVARGSAIEPWTVRAAALFDVPLVTVSVDDSVADVRIDCEELSRDAAVIAIADRVDAIHVRRGGNVETCLRKRLSLSRDASTRVAIMGGRKDAANRLITDGAIGWYLAGRNSSLPQTSTAESTLAGPPPTKSSSPDADWSRTDGQWLIHCTRSRHGPWPGETESQYQDSVLVDHPAATHRGPIDALERIVRSQCLIASAVATTRSEPVVCFSALPLADILQRRCFRPHLGRWDYEPFGVAVRKQVLAAMGGRPVIYGEPESRRKLAPADRFLFQAAGNTYDWRAEREWRINTTVQLGTLSADDVRVFASDSPTARQALTKSPWPVTWLSE
ncbi:hypothetical protein [Rubripirellula reticaptiva]|uniref:Uncharacterized protein n=1 Tax=Rubripirellula reticaptiva TaxID=2528013 RepID=A0A5C6EI40_9BACT|nr:hypothetical protein [Rubripirellula reticaptiva]TWU48210.1 hypothetical protein Poly59_50560 [Rubripirellula reticaptiva]